MSNHENEIIKENIYEDLLERGYSDRQIEQHHMVDELFYHDKQISDILSTITPENPAYNLQKKRVNG